jgi:hypothetical protein
MCGFSKVLSVNFFLLLLLFWVRPSLLFAFISFDPFQEWAARNNLIIVSIEKENFLGQTDVVVDGRCEGKYEEELALARKASKSS